MFHKNKAWTTEDAIEVEVIGFWFRRSAQKVGFSQRCNECDWCIGYPALLCLNLPCRDTSRSRGFRRCQKDCSSLQVSAYFSATFSQELSLGKNWASWPPLVRSLSILYDFLLLQDHAYSENIQTGSSLNWSPVHSFHSSQQLQRAGSTYTFYRHGSPHFLKVW